MVAERESEFVVLSDTDAYVLCREKKCYLHGEGEHDCPIRVAEAKVLDGVADDLPDYLR